MGNRVVIEGSRMPCADLPTGVRRTVEVTEQVRRRVAYGYYVVVEGSLTSPVSGSEQESEAPPAPSAGDIPDENVPGDVTPPTPTAPVTAPPLDADRAVWAAFLDNHQPPIDYPPVAARDDLIIIWQQASGGS